MAVRAVRGAVRLGRDEAGPGGEQASGPYSAAHPGAAAPLREDVVR
ncbi:hypothetical protein ACIRF8_33105 [Streptomyces sp. NPDC102406]